MSNDTSIELPLVEDGASPTMDIKLWKQQKSSLEKNLLNNLTALVRNNNVEQFASVLKQGSADLESLYQKLRTGADSSPCKTIDNKNLRKYFGELCKSDTNTAFVAAFLAILPFGDELIQQLTNQYPIHIAINAEAFSVAKTLLNEPKMDVNALWKKQTPLMLLLKKVNSSNLQQVEHMVDLLAKKGADINIGDYKAHPLSVVCHLGTIDEQQKIELLKLCRQRFNCDVDSTFDGKARRDLEALFGELKFEPRQTEITAAVLKSRLLEGKEDMFLEGFDEFYEKRKTSEVYDLLRLASVKNRSKCVEKVFSRIANSREGFMKQNKIQDVPKVACSKGYAKVLKLFLKYVRDAHFFNESTLVLTCVRNLYKKKSRELEECLDVLLNDGRIEVEKCDHLGQTALHFAIQHDMEQEALKIMIKRSPYLGQLNRYNKSPLHSMSASTLQKFLDSRVSVKSVRSEDLGEEIQLSLRGFVPQPRQKPRMHSPRRQTRRTDLVSVDSAASRISKETEVLRYIADNKELRPLLKHPTITAFLQVKWLLMHWIIYAKLLTSVLMAVIFVIYALYPDSVTIRIVGFLFIAAFSVIFLISTLQCRCSINNMNHDIPLRQRIQWLISTNFHRLKLRIGYLELAIVCLAIVSLIAPSNSILSVLVVLTGINIVTHIGLLPFSSLSTGIVMLETVSRNFLKHLLIYAIIVVAFAFGFYVLFTPYKSENKDEEFNNFVKFGDSLVKSVVMLTGEFDAASITFSNDRTSYLLFMGFVFLVSLVISNLISGMAVSDISAIRQEAEVVALGKKVQTLAQYERLNEPFQYIKQNLAFFRHYEPEILIRPKQNNRIVIVLKSKHREFKEFPTWPIPQVLRRFFCLDGYHELDEETANAAQELVVAGNAPEAAADLRSYGERLRNVEEKLDVLIQLLSVSREAATPVAVKRWQKATTLLANRSLAISQLAKTKR